MSFKKILQTSAFSLLLSIAFSAYATDTHWTYEEQADWGALENADTSALPPALYPFAECGLGQKQSPIDLNNSVTSSLNAIKPLYNVAPLSVNNNGHTIKVNMPNPSNNGFTIGRENYQLLQFHFHAPSEHTLNGKSFPLELHFVHATASGKLAVLGVFIKTGVQTNAEFQKILNNAPTSTNVTNSPVNETINPNLLLPATRKFYNYAGSLTTPPCTEGVDWYVLKQPLVISADQLAQFESLYMDNNRLVQPDYGRVISNN